MSSNAITTVINKLLRHKHPIAKEKHMMGAEREVHCCIIWVAMYIYGLGDVKFTLPSGGGEGVGMMVITVGYKHVLGQLVFSVFSVLLLCYQCRLWCC